MLLLNKKIQSPGNHFLHLSFVLSIVVCVLISACMILSNCPINHPVFLFSISSRQPVFLSSSSMSDIRIVLYICSRFHPVSIISLSSCLLCLILPAWAQRYFMYMLVICIILSGCYVGWVNMYTIFDFSTFS